MIGFGGLCLEQTCAACIISDEEYQQRLDQSDEVPCGHHGVHPPGPFIVKFEAHYGDKYSANFDNISRPGHGLTGYRRNSDDSLRFLERQYNAEPIRENLQRLNNAKARVGMESYLPPAYLQQLGEELVDITNAELVTESKDHEHYQSQHPLSTVDIKFYWLGERERHTPQLELYR
jgi:hypothetical protein